TARVSLTASGAAPTGATTTPLYRLRPTVSDDGRYVAFETSAFDLVPGDANRGITDVYLRDRDVDGDGIYDEIESSTTLLVSQATDGATSAAESSQPLMSADGRWILFESGGQLGGPSTLVPFNLYVRDRVAGTTVTLGLDPLTGTERG